MWKIFARMWQVNWAEQWQYRANLLMYQFYSLVSPIVFLSVWRAVATSQGNVSGLTVNDFTTYYLVLLIVENLTSEITIWVLAYKIQDGTLASDLLRPVHPILVNTLVNNLASKMLNFLALMPVWTILALLFRPDFSAIIPQNLLLGLPAILMGFAINFLLGAIITCVAFWTTQVYSLSEFVFALVSLLGGMFVPLELLPALARQAALLLPFQLYLYFPIQLILGRLSLAQVAWDFAMQGVWLVVLILIFQWIWRAGLKQFSAVGA